ncbi:MAG: multiheme c-type cytochrome, partial [Nannocystaceae bacterium]
MPEVKRRTHAKPAYRPKLARRCGECHGNHLENWLGSGHAQSAKSKLYQHARGTEDAGCDRCHAPLRAVAGSDKLVVEEGINCEVCHGISAVRHGELGGTFDLSLTDNRKFGPVCDGNQHYFHKLGCAPLFEESKFCASCHSWTRTLANGKKLPVFTTFEEWQASGQVATCQDCHMQQERGSLATGWRNDRLISDHGFLAASKFDASLTMNAQVEQVGGAGKPWVVRASVTNAYAAHAFPAGLPGKVLVLRIRALDKLGGELARKEYQF